MDMKKIGSTGDLMECLTVGQKNDDYSKPEKVGQ
jgi:hypothetical protein